MIQLLKAVSIKTWIFIGILIVTGGGMVFYYKAFNNSLVDKGTLVQETATLKDNAAYQELTNKITDSVVKRNVEEKVTIINETQDIRKEAIDEYTKAIVKSSSVETVVSKSLDADTIDRIGKLSARMHEVYCIGSPEDARCDTSRPIK